MASERVQKILAKAGITSRRKAEELILEGLVTINGKIAKLGDKAEWGKDAVKVKGKLLHQTDAPVYIALNKPKGVISMLAPDPEGRATLADFLDKIKTRVFPVGRLDFNSEGLLLLTNDGDFAEKMQKQGDILRIYTVKIKGHLDEEMMSRLKRPVRTQGRLLKPYSVRMGQKLQNKTQMEVVIQGGGAVDIKSFFELKGFLVERIVRTAIGHVTMKDLKPGEFKHLKASQAYALVNQPELGMRRLEHEESKVPPPRLATRPELLPQPLATPVRGKKSKEPSRRSASHREPKITPRSKSRESSRSAPRPEPRVTARSKTRESSRSGSRPEPRSTSRRTPPYRS